MHPSWTYVSHSSVQAECQQSLAQAQPYNLVLHYLFLRVHWHTMRNSSACQILGIVVNDVLAHIVIVPHQVQCGRVTPQQHCQGLCRQR